MDNIRIGRSVCRLHTIMQTLRGPDGCPWDALQTTASLKPFLLEEVYELLEALDGGNPDQIRDELGDVLLQIVFHAQIFAEQAHFDLADVAEAISDKLERRHPHVFGDIVESEIPALNRQWARIKAAEKGEPASRKSALEGIPAALPALARAARFLERTSREAAPEPDAIEAEAALVANQQRLAHLAHLATGGADPTCRESAFGDFLLAAVRWGRSLDLDAEQTLRQALDRLAGEGSHPHSPPSE